MSLMNEYLKANRGSIKPAHLDKSKILHDISQKFLKPSVMSAKEIEFLDWYFREFAEKVGFIKMMKPYIGMNKWKLYTKKCKTKGDLRRLYDFLLESNIDPL